MKTHDFYFDLPQELIAQTPIERRDASRLLVLDKTTGAWEHRHFFDLPRYLVVHVAWQMASVISGFSSLVMAKKRLR